MGVLDIHLLETPRHVAPPIWDLLLHLSKLSLSSPQGYAACPRAPDILFIQRHESLSIEPSE